MDGPLFNTVQQLLSVPDDLEKLLNAPTQTYVRDTQAIASTPMDIKEYPGHYAFVVDMPGLKSNDIRVQVEDENVLSLVGERKRDEKEDEEAKYIRMERRVGKFMRKFTLPGDCNLDAISAKAENGVLTVTVPKLPPPEPKKPKTIQVQIA